MTSSFNSTSPSAALRTARFTAATAACAALLSTTLVLAAVQGLSAHYHDGAKLAHLKSSPVIVAQR